MEYKSTSGGNYPPKIRFTSQEEAFPKGTWFVGTKVKETKGKEFKKEEVVDGKIVTSTTCNLIFTFKVHDTHDKLKIQKKNGKVWEDFALPENGEAELNGNSQLDDKVSQVPLGQKIRVTYNGKKLNESSGRFFNDYTVKDAEEAANATN